MEIKITNKQQQPQSCEEQLTGLCFKWQMVEVDHSVIQQSLKNHIKNIYGKGTVSTNAIKYTVQNVISY